MLRLRNLAMTLASMMMLASPIQAEVLVLGSVNDNIRKHVDRFTPLAAYLTRELEKDGITEVRVTVLKSSGLMARALAEGEVDLHFDSPLVAAQVVRMSGATPFLRRWKGGSATYRSLIIVPRDSPVQSLAGLNGRRIGFQEPDSTSGFLLPMAMLLNHGLTARKLEDRSHQVSASEVGYLFTDDDKNTVLWLTRGWVDAGATDPRGHDMLRENFPDQFRILAQSADVPRQVVLHRPGLDPQLLARLTNLLTGLEDSEEGRSIMKRLHKTTRFDPFPEGVEATFAPLYRALEVLHEAGVLGEEH